MMKFDEILIQVRLLLEQEGRVSYRALKRRFDIDDEYLEDLKAELIDAKRVAVDEDGKVLVWVGVAPVANFESRVPSSTQSLTPNPQPLAERRQLTVMFCDLVGSTALSTQLDPEELRDIVRTYQQTCSAVIQRYDGHIAQYLGDGILVYFGYPTAHEDDAARAVRAGLAIIEAIRSRESGTGGQEGLQSLSAQLLHPSQVRIGIHTGPVVVGEMGGGAKRELLALGETPNLAARIQGQAAPNEVVISTATYRLVEGLFECEDRGQPELKGASTPLTLYRVVKESQAQSRFEVVARRGLTPLIGRDHEYGLLRERWEQAKSGEGQGVLLSGEPGIGKSRLVEALKESVEHEGTSCLELRCSPYHQNSALYPVTEHLQRVLGLQSGDSPEEKLCKLEVGARCAVSLQPEAIPLLATLLSLPQPEGYPTLTLSPQKQKEKTLEALVVWLCVETKQQAVTYAWGDLHWADQSTLELLTLFLNQVPTTRLLAVLTFRPEFTPPWGTYSYLSQLTLSRLGRTHVETMVEKVTGGKALPREVVQQIVIKTDGVPLFVEELTKSVVESVGAHGGAPLPPLAIPSTLQDSLMARLDRLGPAKEIAQVGATIGREFNYDVLRAVAPLNEETLQRGLKQLVETELVYRSGVPPQARYLFKHALVQETAYQSLLKSRRQQLHQQVAQVLAEQFSETVTTQPELVAHHYTEAGFTLQAIPYWQRAGQHAVQRSANIEAIGHLTRGLELLKTLPDTPQRSQQELLLQLPLGAAYLMTRGNAAPEVSHAYNRAHALCQQMGNTSQLIPALFGLYRFYYGRAEYHMARQLGEQLLGLAEQGHDSATLVLAHYVLGTCLYQLGEAVLARAHLEKGMGCYDPMQHRSLSFLAGIDPGIGSYSYGACVLWLLGYPDHAFIWHRKALSLAEDLAHPSTQAHAFLLGAFLSMYGGEAPAAQGWAENAIALSREQGNVFYLAQATITRGWALAKQGRGEEGVIAIQQSLVALRAPGAEAGWTLWQVMLAQAYATEVQTEEGLTVVAEGLAAVERNNECFWEAELYRLKGTLTLQKFQVSSSKFQVPPSPQPLTLNPQAEAEAEACFLKAIEVAQHQQAKSLELRATTSLARLWQSQSKQREAHHMLAEVYGWFTEGFDTKDLQEAKALLEGVSRTLD